MNGVMRAVGTRPFAVGDASDCRVPKGTPNADENTGPSR